MPLEVSYQCGYLHSMTESFFLEKHTLANQIKVFKSQAKWAPLIKIVVNPFDE